MTAYKALTTFAGRVLPGPIAEALRGAVRERRDRRNRLELESRKAAWAGNAGQSEPLIAEVQPGIRFAAYADSELCRLIYIGGYELIERQFVHRFLRPGDTFVDVGANIGLYAVVAANAVGPGGVVYAFEPCSRTFARLRENIVRNRLANVRAEQAALSDSDGTLKMLISTDGFDAWNSAGAPTRGGSIQEEIVRSEKWDSFVVREKLAGRIALIKVDIEGWESQFLAGGAGSLAAPDAPVILMEWNDEAARTAGSSVAQVRSQLQNLGYVVYYFDPEGDLRLLNPSDPLKPSQNVIALKDFPHVQERLRTSPPCPWMR